ncbi:hypothetical protein BY458DRAFT_512423 [Sporodiniella umbellata]|nr:hypothetical protein BY458DRAFT_512423 [Sporodiniella umbellata]
MGQRQSTSEDSTREEERQEQSASSRNRGRVIRPESRTGVERTNPLQAPRVQLIPVNESQRRAERRERRAEQRELQQQQQQEETSSTDPPLSPFARMLAQVISEAVITSFRSGQIPFPAGEEDWEGRQNSIRQQLTMHLSPELFQQMEPESDENSFMRFMRLPVIVSNVEEAGEEMTRILMLPVFLYGVRSHPSSPRDPQRRQSERIRERLQREQGTVSSGQWTVYIISGNSVENVMSEHNPTYEELLDLANIIGPARRLTVSQEAIDLHVPIVKYTQQVKQRIVGNAEGCQVCLSSYQSQEDVRILACHHGFHKDCIDQWLTQGQNQCPLCRNVPVPPSQDALS